MKNRHAGGAKGTDELGKPWNNPCPDSWDGNLDMD
jgi:hypothetical protein